MSAPLLVAVALAGGLGAVARVLVDAAVSRRAGARFPYGILAVNVLGSFLLGLLAGATGGGPAYDVAATGALGAFTTFSTWVLDSDRLVAGGRRGAAAVNVGLSLVLGLAAAWVGRRLGVLP